jgi:hypothetical protein
VSRQILNKVLLKAAKVTEEVEEIEITVKDLIQEILQRREKRKNHVLNKNCNKEIRHYPSFKLILY